jgi:hypothetical protein
MSLRCRNSQIVLPSRSDVPGAGAIVTVVFLHYRYSTRCMLVIAPYVEDWEGMGIGTTQFHYPHRRVAYLVQLSRLPVVTSGRTQSKPRAGIGRKADFSGGGGRGGVPTAGEGDPGGSMFGWPTAGAFPLWPFSLQLAQPVLVVAQSQSPPADQPIPKPRCSPCRWPR